MSEPYSVLREYRKRIVAMHEDPECTGELLALGISLLDFAVTRTTRTEKNFNFYAARAWGAVYGRSHIDQVLRTDIRRYDGAKDAGGNAWARACGAPMVRRVGPCGQSGTLRTMLTDPETGRRQWLAACSRHREWFESRVRENRLAVDSEDVVTTPPANAGGVLERHIPEIDWEAVWLRLDPAWTRPPETEPVVVPLKPKLTLVLGGAS